MVRYSLNSSGGRKGGDREGKTDKVWYTSELGIRVAQHAGKVGRPIFLRINGSNFPITVAIPVDD